MGKLGLGYVMNAVLDDLKDTEERRILLDTKLDKEGRTAALTALEGKIRRYKKDFSRNLDDVYPGDIKKALRSDVRETKRGR
ncbi:hypothetical protein HWB91_gp57 [Bacillus phage vB_BboS-125]|uniref:Uncharacterized protein n=1 Tax=Bacillus phage vB_BboS-125 TaxID=2419618 RepID=A0A3G3BW91_9CAUD|nr:hypothetical protein HWB91_gp57 [Bacillus phage vB_BboS-125]AYP68427.1 hypothetical protein BboS125_00058 [Bacillus phage vB_BboS-125]